MKRLALNVFLAVALTGVFVSSTTAQVTKVTSGTLTQTVNGNAGTDYTSSGDTLAASKEWKFDTGPTGAVVDVVTSWTPGGSGSTTASFTIPGNATDWPVSVSSSHIVQTPAPGALTCNFSMTYTGNSVANVTPAPFFKAGGGGGL